MGQIELVYQNNLFVLLSPINESSAFAKSGKLNLTPKPHKYIARMLP